MADNTVSISPEWLREYFLMDQELALLKKLLKKSTPSTIEAILSYLESEQALLPTLNTLIREEIAMCSDMTTLFREESPTTLLLSVCYSLKVSKKYLKKTLLPIFKQIIPLPQSIEVKLDATTSVETAANNAYYLTVVVKQILKNLENELPNCPYFIRYALRILQTEVVEKYPDMKESVIGGFFFLRYICPALVTPEKHNLIVEPLPPHTRRTMILISKIIQNMGVGVMFDKDIEPHMEYFNPLISSKNSEISAFYGKITDRREMNKSWKAEKRKHRASNSKTITSKQKLALKSAVEEENELIAEVVNRINHLVPSVHPKFWSYVDVNRWVNDANINPEDADLFFKAKIDGNELLNLDKTRLEQIGISKLGQRMKYSKLINNLKEKWQSLEEDHNAGLQEQLKKLENSDLIIAWSPYIVKLWCESKGLVEVGNELYKEGVTGRNLLALDNEDLISFGIFNPRWRSYLLNMINQLRSDTEIHAIKVKKNFHYINCHVGLNCTETINIPKSKPNFQKIMQQLEIHHGSGLELIYIDIYGAEIAVNDNNDLANAIKWMKDGNKLEFIARKRMEKPMINWNSHDVNYWLQTLEILTEPADSILTQNIDGECLLKDGLDDAKIKSWGITKLGHIKRLKKNVKDFNTPGMSPIANQRKSSIVIRSQSDSTYEKMKVKKKGSGNNSKITSLF